MPEEYRKKPVVVEAMQMPLDPDEYQVEAIVEWIEPGIVEAWDSPDIGEGPISSWGINYLEINTLEGEMTARLGDYVIKGVQGEFYPCKSSIFSATYEPVGAE